MTDLGTARGKVRVDADTKGVKNAARDLKGLDKAFEIVGKAGQAFEKGLNKMERELKQSTRDINATDRAADGLSSAIQRANSDTLVWITSLKGLQERLKGVNTVAKVAGPSLLQIAKTGIEFKKTNGGIVGFAQALTRAGVAATGISMLKNSFFGMGAAMAAMPAWSNQVIKFSNSFRLLTFGIGTLSALAIKTGVFGKVYESVFRKVVKHSEMGGKAFMAMESRIRPLIPSLKKGATYVKELNDQVDKIPKGAIQALVGFAMLQGGVRGLIGRFAFLTRLSPKVMAIVGAAFSSLPAIIQAGAASLTIFSNALLLAKDAGTQLAGGLLAIPGAITMMITGIGTLKVLFKSLATAFEDVFKAENAEELAAAIDALPEHLKPLGKVFGEIIPQWKGLVEEMQKTFVIGAAEQLKALSDTYLPAVKSGVLPLVNAFRQVKDSLVGFLAQGESVSFVKQAFRDTAQTVINLKDALVPLLTGFRDIASVGMTFIRDMSGGAETVTQKFADWAKANKDNGNLMKWMKDAVQGVKDLWSGLKDAAEALWTLLTLFATDSGENALGRFADAMERFNDAVKKSAASGILKQIGDAVKTMGTERLEQFMDVMKSLGDSLQKIIPFVIELSEAFGSTFFPALKLTLELIEKFAQVANALGIDKFLGVVLGLAAAFKTLSIVLGPIRNVLQIVVGGFNLFKGAETLILGVAGALEKFGPNGRKASDALLGVGDTIKSVFGGLGIAAAAGLAFYEFYQAGAKQIDNMKSKVSELDTFTEGMGQKIASQIIDQGTLQNQAQVFADTIDEMRTKLQEAGEAKPGLAGSFVDQVRAATDAGKKRIAGARAGVDVGPVHTEGFDKLSKAAEDAKKADEAIDNLGMTTDELNDKVLGTKAGFDQFIATLKTSGEGGEEAATRFTKMREEFEALQRVGEGGIQIASGIDKIADSAGDAATKLDGLKTALEGAGLLQSDAIDAAFDYAQAIRDITTATESAADQQQPFNDILNATGDGYNTASVNGANLHNAIRDLEQDYLRAVANGEDATTAWEKQGPALQKLADDFKLPIDKVKQLAALEGGVPDEIKLLLSVEGADEVKQDVVAAVLAAKSAAEDQPVTIAIEGDPAQVKQMIEGLLGPGSVIASTDGTITLSANLDEGALNNALAQLAAAGITVPGHPAPAKPLEVGVAPKIVEPDRKGTKKQEGPAPAPITKEQDTSKVVQAGPPPAPPKVAPSAADQASLDQAKTTIDNIKTAVDELNGKKIKIEVEAEALNNLTTSIDQIITSLSEKKLKLKVELEGLDAFNTGMNTIKTAITTSEGQWRAYESTVKGVFQAIVSAFDTAMSQLVAKMQAAGANNQAAGKAFGDAFAQGIRDSIPAITQAATDAAAAAAAPMPGSPAKTGPLSGRGWTKYRGQAFVKDFAEGIQSETSAAADASEAMAERATGSMEGRDERFQGFLSGLLRVLDLASTAISLVQESFDHVLEGAKLIDDLISGKLFKKEEPETPETEHGKRAGEAPGPGGAPTATSAEFDRAVLAQVKAGHYSQTGNADLTKGLGDCSSAVEDLVNIMDKKPTGGRQMSTGNAAAWLTSRGFKKGEGGPGDMRVAFNVNHMQATLPGGTNFNWGSEAAAAAGGLAKNLGAGDPSLTSKFYRTAVNGEQASQFAEEVSDKELFVSNPTQEQQENTNIKTLSQGDQDIVKELRENNTTLDDSIKTAEDPTKTDDEALEALNSIQKEIDALGGINGEGNKQQVQALEGVKAGVEQMRGIEAGGAGEGTAESASANAISMIGSIGSGIAGALQAIVGIAKTAIETVGFVKASMDTLVRGVENTEDIMVFIDTFQKFIEIAAKVAQGVSDVTGAIAGIIGAAGGADPSGGVAGAAAAFQLISMISGMIAGVLNTINAVIDFAQEAYHILGSYFGQFLGFLAGAGDQLEGDTKFLLDQNDKTLKAYSRNNPQNKAVHPMAGEFLTGQGGPLGPQIGSITVFGGPGQDPRDTTRNMMFAVKTAAMGATYAQ